MEWDIGYDDAVTHAFPPFMKGYDEKARRMGSQYFSSFQGFPGYDVVASEERFTVSIGAYRFKGIVDLVLRNKDGLFIVDHKTKSPSSMQKDYSLFRRQLYIYAQYVKDKYGEYPARLAFNMIKTGKLIDEPFSMAEMKDTVEWAEAIIDEINMCEDFEANTSSRCRILCDQRKQCQYFMEQV